MEREPIDATAGSSRSRLALAVFGCGTPELASVGELDQLGLDCVVYTSPEEMLADYRGEARTFDLAMLTIEYKTMSGPELAWRLRRRYPLTPIVMLARELGTWDPEDIYDCGVNVLLEGPQDADGLKRGIRPLLERLSTPSQAHAKRDAYARIVLAALSGDSKPARIVSAERLILYENEHVQSLVGDHTGCNCHDFWQQGGPCTTCAGVAALERDCRISRIGRREDGVRVRCDAVPVTLEDGSRAVVEVFHFGDSA